MIELKNLSIRFPSFSVRDVNLHVAEGEFFALLGPTGAGKTLILEAIAGIVPVTAGKIFVRGNDVTHIPPEKRNVGIVYQDLGLFPHLSAIDNIRYGLRYHRGAAHVADQAQRVRELVHMLGLEHLLERSVQNLSGGERQRIALARCLSVNPSLVLLDEPLSALDANKRDEVLILLKDLHENLRITFMMVTHEFSQVMFLAQRAAIINKGRLEQVGDVRDIFRKPQSTFTAEFVGMKNLLPATFHGDSAHINGLPIRVPDDAASRGRYIGIRPENIRLTSDRPDSAGDNVIEALIRSVRYVGPYYEVTVQGHGIELRAFLTETSLPAAVLKSGTKVFAAFEPEAVHVL
jgi:molybdate/tungstate transport system ATP-binding protein